MLGDINPQSIKITSQAVIYPGRNHVTVLNIKRFSGRQYSAVDLSLLTRAVLVFPQTDPVIAYDTATAPAGTITWAGSDITIDLSDFSMPASVQSSYLIVYDAEHLGGQVLVDDNDSIVEFDFRNVSASGIIQPPVLELVSEAPADGLLYGRQNGTWVSIDAVVAGVSSVNGLTGTVVLDPDDIGGEWPLAAGTNVTIDRTIPTAPVINVADSAGSVASVNGQTGVVVLTAADVGADAAGTAAAEAEDARFDSTGLISGGILTINVDTTKFDLSETVAVFADYTDPSKSVATVSTFGPFTAVVVPNLATALVSYVGINSAGVIVQQTAKFTNIQRRSIVSLGVLVHSNNLNLNAINSIVAPARQLLNQFGDGLRAIGQLNLSGNVYGPIGATLQVQKTSGELFSPGANFHVNPDDPHSAVLSAVSPVTFRYRLSNSTEFADRSVVDPANYDLAGVLTAVPANRYTVQLISVFQSGITRIQYGQALYVTLSDAVNAAQSQSMVIEPNILDNGVIRGYLAIKGNATALDDPAQAVFITLSKFSAFATVSPITLATTDELAEGTLNLYFTATRVRQTLLTGLSLAVNAAITAADTMLDALGKLQAQITSHFGVGGSAHPDATTTVSGFMSGGDKTKFDGVEAGAQANVATNIAQGTRTATTVPVTSSTGTGATLDVATATLAGVMSAADKTTLDGAQPALVSGTNIKTVNGATILGAGDLTVTAAPAAVITEATTARVLGLADANTYIRYTNAGASITTVAPQASVAWVADTEIHHRCAGAGGLTLTEGAGVTLIPPSGGTLAMTTGMSVTLKRVGTDVWDVIGQTVAA